MKKFVVVDANIAIKWAVNEEDSNTALGLLSQWSNNKVTMIAPALFVYEVTNILHQSVRKAKINVTQAKQTLEQILALGVQLKFTEDAPLSLRSLELADQYKLPATYDPHYLALAEREECECWTADTRCWRAVKDKLPWVRLLAEYKQAQ